MKGNILSDTVITTLCDGLIENKILIGLNISSNDITSYGADKIKDALLTTELKELDMSGNPLGNQGVDSIC